MLRLTAFVLCAATLVQGGPLPGAGAVKKQATLAAKDAVKDILKNALAKTVQEGGAALIDATQDRIGPAFEAVAAIREAADISGMKDKAAEMVDMVANVAPNVMDVLDRLSPDHWRLFTDFLTRLADAECEEDVADVIVDARRAAVVLGNGLSCKDAYLGQPATKNHWDAGTYLPSTLLKLNLPVAAIEDETAFFSDGSHTTLEIGVMFVSYGGLTAVENPESKQEDAQKEADRMATLQKCINDKVVEPQFAVAFSFNPVGMLGLGEALGKAAYHNMAGSKEAFTADFVKPKKDKLKFLYQQLLTSFSIDFLFNPGALGGYANTLPLGSALVQLWNAGSAAVLTKELKAERAQLQQQELAEQQRLARKAAERAEREWQQQQAAMRQQARLQRQQQEAQQRREAYERRQQELAEDRRRQQQLEREQREYWRRMEEEEKRRRAANDAEALRCYEAARGWHRQNPLLGVPNFRPIPQQGPPVCPGVPDNGLIWIHVRKVREQRVQRFEDTLIQSRYVSPPRPTNGRQYQPPNLQQLLAGHGSYSLAARPKLLRRQADPLAHRKLHDEVIKDFIGDIGLIQTSHAGFKDTYPRLFFYDMDRAEPRFSGVAFGAGTAIRLAGRGLLEIYWRVTSTPAAPPAVPSTPRTSEVVKGEQKASAKKAAEQAVSALVTFFFPSLDITMYDGWNGRIQAVSSRSAAVLSSSSTTDTLAALATGSAAELCFGVCAEDGVNSADKALFGKFSIATKCAADGSSVVVMEGSDIGATLGGLYAAMTGDELPVEWRAVLGKIGFNGADIAADINTGTGKVVVRISPTGSAELGDFGGSGGLFGDEAPEPVLRATYEPGLEQVTATASLVFKPGPPISSSTSVSVRNAAGTEGLVLSAGLLGDGVGVSATLPVRVCLSKCGDAKPQVVDFEGMVFGKLTGVSPARVVVGGSLTMQGKLTELFRLPVLHLANVVVAAEVEVAPAKLLKKLHIEGSVELGSVASCAAPPNSGPACLRVDGTLHLDIDNPTLNYAEVLFQSLTFGELYDVAAEQVPLLRSFPVPGFVRAYGVQYIEKDGVDCTGVSHRDNRDCAAVVRLSTAEGIEVRGQFNFGSFFSLQLELQAGPGGFYLHANVPSTTLLGFIELTDATLLLDLRVSAPKKLLLKAGAQLKYIPVSASFSAEVSEDGLLIESQLNLLKVIRPEATIAVDFTGSGNFLVQVKNFDAGIVQVKNVLVQKYTGGFRFRFVVSFMYFLGISVSADINKQLMRFEVSAELAVAKVTATAIPSVSDDIALKFTFEPGAVIRALADAAKAVGKAVQAIGKAIGKAAKAVGKFVGGLLGFNQRPIGTPQQQARCEAAMEGRGWAKGVFQRTDVNGRADDVLRRMAENPLHRCMVWTDANPQRVAELNRITNRYHWDSEDEDRMGYEPRNAMRAFGEECGVCTPGEHYCAFNYKAWPNECESDEVKSSLLYGCTTHQKHVCYDDSVFGCLHHIHGVYPDLTCYERQAHPWAQLYNQLAADVALGEELQRQADASSTAGDALGGAPTAQVAVEVTSDNEHTSAIGGAKDETIVVSGEYYVLEGTKVTSRRLDVRKTFVVGDEVALTNAMGVAVTKATESLTLLLHQAEEAAEAARATAAKTGDAAVVGEVGTLLQTAAEEAGAARAAVGSAHQTSRGEASMGQLAASLRAERKEVVVESTQAGAHATLDQVAQVVSAADIRVQSNTDCSSAAPPTVTLLRVTPTNGAAFHTPVLCSSAFFAVDWEVRDACGGEVLLQQQVAVEPTWVRAAAQLPGDAALTVDDVAAGTLGAADAAVQTVATWTVGGQTLPTGWGAAAATAPTVSAASEAGPCTWRYTRTWVLRQDRYDDSCHPAKAVTHTQKVDVRDTLDAFAVPSEVQVPFFRSFHNASHGSEPRSELDAAPLLRLAIGHADVTVESIDAAVPVAARRADELFAFERTWTVRLPGACAAAPRVLVQRVAVLAPTELLPAEAPKAKVYANNVAERAFAPLVEQRADACAPGKRVVGLGATVPHRARDACEPNTWRGDGCRSIAPAGAAVHDVLLPPPTFTSFPSDADVDASQKVGPAALGRPTVDADGLPHVVDFVDSEATLVDGECGAVAFTRTWSVRHLLPGCEDDEAVAATVQVQRVVVRTKVADTFATTPPTPLAVPFTENLQSSFMPHPQLWEIDPSVRKLLDRSNASVAAVFDYTLVATDSCVTNVATDEERCTEAAWLSWTRTWVGHCSCGCNATFEQKMSVEAANASDAENGLAARQQWKAGVAVYAVGVGAVDECMLTKSVWLGETHLAVSSLPTDQCTGPLLCAHQTAFEGELHHVEYYTVTLEDPEVVRSEGLDANLSAAWVTPKAAPVCGTGGRPPLSFSTQDALLNLSALTRTYEASPAAGSCFAPLASAVQVQMVFPPLQPLRPAPPPVPLVHDCEKDGPFKEADSLLTPNFTTDVRCGEIAVTRHRQQGTPQRDRAECDGACEWDFRTYDWLAVDSCGHELAEPQDVYILPASSSKLPLPGYMANVFSKEACRFVATPHRWLAHKVYPSQRECCRKAFDPWLVPRCLGDIATPTPFFYPRWTGGAGCVAAAKQEHWVMPLLPLFPATEEGLQLCCRRKFWWMRERCEKRGRRGW